MLENPNSNPPKMVNSPNKGSTILPSQIPNMKSVYAKIE